MLKLGRDSADLYMNLEENINHELLPRRETRRDASVHGSHAQPSTKMRILLVLRGLHIEPALSENRASALREDKPRNSQMVAWSSS